MRTEYYDLVPLGSNVLIRRDEPETVTKGGLHLPETELERPPEATVINLGIGDDEEPFEVDPGDHVLIEKYGGNDLGDGWQVIPHSQIVGILEDSGTSLIPLQDFIVVRMLPREEQQGVIVIPEANRETQEWGVVVGVAEGCEVIKEGWYAHIPKTTGMHYKVGAKDYIIIRERRVHAVIEKG